MNEISDYELVCEYGRDVLAHAVNELIKEGYQPFGSISVCNLTAPNESHIYYSQAMVKYQNNTHS